MAAVCILALLLVPACGREAETGPSIDEVLPFDDADVEVVEFRCGWMRDENGDWRGLDLLITGQEDIDHILGTLRALEPIGYYDGQGTSSNAVIFIFHLQDGRLYTMYCRDVWTSVADAALLENDAARIIVPFDKDFLGWIMQLDDLNIWPPGESVGSPPDLGYSDPGDAPMEWYPYW